MADFLFEVKSKNKTIMHTESPECVYPPEILEDMYAAGYDIFVNKKKSAKVIYKISKSCVTLNYRGDHFG